jgi:hypothetical protein
MTQFPTQEYELDLAGDRPSEEELVHDWRVEQLVKLGVPHILAHAFADAVDWHELASLVQRGCPLPVAFDIVR